MSKAHSQPFVLGLGGTLRPGSSTEKALAFALRRCQSRGAETELLGGDFIGKLPLFNPQNPPTAEEEHLANAVRRAHGVIIASPGYHGSLSGLVKNALDALELTRNDEAAYLHGKAVGIIITADGSQAAGTTLMAVRSIIHAMRGWPTPFGAALNSTVPLFDEVGDCRAERDAWQLDTVADQVMEFAAMRLAS